MQTDWRILLQESIAAQDDAPLLVTLATIDEEQTVDARIVVCRYVGTDGSLWFTSDARSRKNQQLSLNPAASAVIWLPESRRQFRFHGTVETVTSSDHRERIWNQLTDATRATFFWPAPGAPRTAGEFEQSADLAQPPPTFSLLKLSHTSVELLELQPTPHRRRRWLSSRGWQVEEFNP